MAFQNQKDSILKFYENHLKIIIKIQSIIKGKIFRKNRLPNSLLTIQKILQENNLSLCKTSEDGRINSCIDEDEIIKILSEKIPNRILRQKKRMWFDVAIFDYIYGFLPVNIKTSTTLTSDNTGNLAMCVYAYTDEKLDITKFYKNGDMSKILLDKLNRKEYNSTDKKDYYFVVINKTNKNDIIINSVKGLTNITPNLNNLPFQIRWNKNKNFKYKKMTENIKMLINAFQKPKLSWKETFLNEIRNIKL